jgi:hypothetical protein
MTAFQMIDMTEATRLTRLGRLTEAMAVLRGGGADSATFAGETTAPGAQGGLDMQPPSTIEGPWMPPSL